MDQISFHAPPDGNQVLMARAVASPTGPDYNELRLCPDSDPACSSDTAAWTVRLPSDRIGRLSSDTSGTMFLVETYPSRGTSPPTWHLLDSSGRDTTHTGAWPRNASRSTSGRSLTGPGALLSRDGHTIAALTGPTTLGVWTTEPFRLDHTVPIPNGVGANESPASGSDAVSSASDRNATLPILEAFTAHSHHLVVNRDGDLVVVDLDDGRQLASTSAPADRKVTSFAASDDGDRAAIGYSDGSIQILSTDDWRPQPTSFDPNPSAVTSVSFDADQLLTSSVDQVRIIDLSDPAPTTQLLPFPGPAYETYVHPLDGGGVLLDGIGMAGAFEPVLWRLGTDTLVERACQAAGRELTTAEWRRVLPDRQQEPTCS
jgi:hypothetical protein